MLWKRIGLFATRFAAGGRASLLSEFVEHSMRDQKTAYDIDHGQHDGHETQKFRQRSVTGTSRKEGSDECNSGDRVRAGHQWGVQRRGNLRDDFEAYEHGQGEDR